MLDGTQPTVIVNEEAFGVLKNFPIVQFAPLL